MSTAVDRHFPTRMLLLASGLLVWGAHFLFIYIFTALACARGFAGIELLGLGIVPVTVAAATIVALAGLALLLRLSWREERRSGAPDREAPRFIRHVAAGLAIYSAIAILLQTFPAFVVPVCA